MNRIDTTQDGSTVASTFRSDGRSGRHAEDLFIARVRKSLDEGASALRPDVLARLELARKSALRAQRLPGAQVAPVTSAALAGGHGLDGSPRLGFGRASVVVSTIVLVGACLAGLYQFEQDRRIAELADVDSAVLNDDLPISAYADHGFNAYIKQNP